MSEPAQDPRPTGPTPGPPSLAVRTRRQIVKRRRPLAIALSIACHLLILLFLFSTQADSPKPAPPGPMTVALVEAPRLAPLPAPSGGGQPAATKSKAHPQPKPAAPEPTPEPTVTKPIPTPVKPRLAHVRPTVPTLPTDAAPVVAKAAAKPAPELSEAELAGAATAGSGEGEGSGSGSGFGAGGSGGGGCDMLRAVQNALRKDPLVQAAVAHGAQSRRAILVWNGDWVSNPGEDGKGLAAVREAIMWEIAFAPAACRNTAVHGLVVISLRDASGFTRLAVGSGDWRWSDLLRR